MVNEAASQQKGPFHTPTAIQNSRRKTTATRSSTNLVNAGDGAEQKKSTPAFAASFCEWVGVFFDPKDEGVDGIQAYLKTLRYVVQDPNDIQQNSSSNVTLRIFLIEGMFFCQFYPLPVESFLIWSDFLMLLMQGRLSLFYLSYPQVNLQGHWNILNLKMFLIFEIETMGMQGSSNYQFGGIKQYKRMVVLRDFPYNYNSALFGFVIEWPRTCSIAHACLPYHFKRFSPCTVPPHHPPPQVQRESAGRFNQIEQNLKSMTEIFYKIWQCCFHYP